MLEFHFIHIDTGNADFLVALHHNSIVSLVVKVGRAVDVVHFHTRSSPGCGVAVHLARVGHEDQEAVILRGKFRKFIQQIRDILRLRLSRCRFVVEAVERVEDEDAATTADNEFAGFGKHTVGGGIAFQGDMGDVLGEKLLGACQQSLRHAAAVLETVAGKFLNQFAEMIDDRDVLRTEEANLPLMSQAETQY